MSIRTILSVAAALCAFAPAFAEAQLFNRPFEFQRRGGGEAVGMSAAYRQAILDRELLNRRPENLVRDRAGRLLGLERGSSNQAFLREQEGAFLPRSIGDFGVGVDGFSLGGTGSATGPGYGGAAFLIWSSMVGDDRASVPWNGAASSGSTPASAVIDGWIVLLASLRE